MKNYGIQKSSVLPNNFEITDSKVFVYENIEEIISKFEEQEITEYQFNLIEYDKDEYIKIISEKNEELNQQIINTQLALCEVYELIS